MACAFCDKAKVLNFAAIELDDEVVFEVGDGHIFARGESGHLSRLFFGIDFEVAGDLERRIGQRRDDGIDLLATFAQRYDIFGADLEAGNVDFAAVDEDMAVVDELAGSTASRSYTQTINDVVKTALKTLQEYLTSNTTLTSSLLKHIAELFLKYAVCILGLLLLSQHQAIL